MEVVVAQFVAELDAGGLGLVVFGPPQVTVVAEMTAHRRDTVEARRLAAQHARRAAQEVAELARRVRCSPDSAERWAVALGPVEASDLVAPTAPAAAPATARCSVSSPCRMPSRWSSRSSGPSSRR